MTGVGDDHLSGRERGLPNPCLRVVGESDAIVWGMSFKERHLRAFARENVRPAGSSAAADAHSANLLFVRAGYVIGPDVVAGLVATRGAALVLPADAHGAREVVAIHATAEVESEASALIELGTLGKDAALPTALTAMEPDELGSEYDQVLRKRAPPLVLSLSDNTLLDIEKITFAAVYKGATDFVTKWCWPVPARWVTRWAAARRISPNTITTLSLVLVVAATILFARGHFLSGIGVGWAMTFLDTVDGKLARVTFTSSRWGNIYDHGIDLIHPPFWWWAWYHALESANGASATLETDLWIIVVGYVLGRLMEGLFIRAFKIETHVWHPVDYVFRTITARRNPNLAILTVFAIAGRPEVGFFAVAAWTIISLTFHAVRLVQAALVTRRGGEVRSWLSESA